MYYSNVIIFRISRDSVNQLAFICKKQFVFLGSLCSAFIYAFDETRFFKKSHESALRVLGGLDMDRHNAFYEPNVYSLILNADVQRYN